jgi:hypothetical protein
MKHCGPDLVLSGLGYGTVAGCFLHCYGPLVLPNNVESKLTLWEFKSSGMLRSVD